MQRYSLAQRRREALCALCPVRHPGSRAHCHRIPLCGLRKPNSAKSHQPRFTRTLWCLLESNGPTLAIVVEVQLRADESKHRSWPVYLAAVRARYRCDACVLVIASTESVARWARRAVALGPGNVFQIGRAHV